MTAAAKTDLEAEIEAYGHDARNIRKMVLTADAVLVLERGLMFMRGNDADNTVGDLYRRILQGRAPVQEIRLVFICAFIGGGYDFDVACWAADRCFEADPAELLYGVARDFLKPFAGKRARPPAIDLAALSANPPRGLCQ